MNPHSSKVHLRRACAADAESIARTHIASWRSTYTGLLPDAVVAERTVWATRLAMWEQRLRTKSATFVAEDENGIIGFASACAMDERPAGRDRVPGCDAYLQSLYLRADGQRRGAGRALLSAVARDLLTGGNRTMALHVLAANPARQFYEHLGAVHVRDEPVEGAGETWFQCAYAFTDLRTLAGGK